MMEVVASTDEASTNEAPPSSWAVTDTPATMDMAMDMAMELATGTEFLPVTTGVLSSGSV
jgi:hypothetical protein